MNQERPTLNYAQPVPRRKTSWVFVIFLLSAVALLFGGMSDVVTVAGGNYTPVLGGSLIACAISISLSCPALFINRNRRVVVLTIIVCGLALWIAADAMSRLVRV
jgi:hypothetical protein